MPTGTEISRRFFSPPGSSRPITLWGSSSMSSEGGGEGTPLAVRIDEHLSLSNNPAPVHAFGIGATRSEHMLLLRGLSTPQVRVLAGARQADGASQVELADGMTPSGPLRCRGTLGEVPGTLDGSSGTWWFRPDDAAADVADGRFISAHWDVAQGSRQVLWMGKNNILDVDGVLADIASMYEAADNPEHDNLILGHWATENDPVGSDTATALHHVNTQLAARYGRAFLDVNAELTTPEGLTSTALRPVRVLEHATTAEALDRGVVPPVLVADDQIHLNGWGNLAVCSALVRRMQELRWL